MPELFKKKPQSNTINQGARTDAEVINMARAFIPGKPGVNILPRSVTDEYKVESMRTRFIAGGAALLVAFGGLFGASAVFHFDQNPDLDNVLAQTEDINTQSQALGKYQTFYTSVDRKRQDLGALLTTDINHGDLLSTIQNAASQSGVSLTSLTVSAPTSAGAAPTGTASTCPSPDPFATVATVGCISFAGVAGDRESIGRFVDTLNATPGLVNAYVPTTTVGEGEGGSARSQVSGTVSFTQELYTGKYNSLTLPLSSIFNPTEEPADTTEGVTQDTTTEGTSGEDS